MNKEDIIRMAQEIAAQYSKAERFQTWTHDYLMQRLMELVTVSAAAEREAISDEWHSSVYSDLEHGVKCLNEQAAKDWLKNYPEIAKFGAWLEERENT